MATRGYKVPLSEGDEEVPGYLMGFTGKDLHKLEQLKKELEFKEEQDVVRLAILMLQKIIDPKPEVKTKKKYVVKLKNDGKSDEN